MSYTKQSNKTKNSSLKKTGRVVALVMALLVLILALLLLLAPMKASNMFESLGMKNLSVSMAHSAAKNSGEFDDWWVVFEKSLDAQNNQMVCVASDNLQKHTDFSVLINGKTSKINDVEIDAKYYLLYHHARCSLIESPDKADEIWDWCKVKYQQAKSSNVNTAQIFNGYISALAEDKNISLDDFFDKAEEVYGKKDVFSNVTSSFKKEFASAVKNLIDKRQDEISEDIKNLWKNR